MFARFGGSSRFGISFGGSFLTDHVRIIRQQTGDQGTEGFLIAPGFSCRVIELPWRDNVRSLSCIPAGDYEATVRQSPRFGTTYWIRKVEGRSFILFHWGNWAGDKTIGFRSHSAGCLLLGKYRGTLQGQRAVLYSRATVGDFMRRLGFKDFNLTIDESFNGGNEND